MVRNSVSTTYEQYFCFGLLYFAFCNYTFLFRSASLPPSPFPPPHFSSSSCTTDPSDNPRRSPVLHRCLGPRQCSSGDSSTPIVSAILVKILTPSVHQPPYLWNALWGGLHTGAQSKEDPWEPCLWVLRWPCAHSDPFHACLRPTA